MKISKKECVFYSVVLLLILIGDLYTKKLITQHFKLGNTLTIIPQFFSLTYVQNRGAAWGMFEGGREVFLGISAVAGCIMIYYFSKTNPKDYLTRLGLVMLFAGMLGNLYDRFFLSYVRDFLNFIILGYDFPVFNIADMGVTIGMFLIILVMIKGELKEWKQKKLQS